jgi:formamidopyrimidine-DNA glycosylase
VQHAITSRSAHDYTHRGHARGYTDAMPELPEIETFKRYLDDTSLRQQIRGVTVTKERILKDVSSRQLSSALKNHSFRGSERHGKYLVVDVGGGKQLVLHFGMTGCLHYVDQDDPDSRYARMIVTFDNGHRLDYDNKRMLGRVRLVDDFDDLVDELELGPDALEIGADEFDQRLRPHGGAIKSTLMNQSIVAGLGNTYTDEILFQARIHPATPVDTLSATERKSIYRMMRKVLRKAIDVQGEPDRMPRSYLVPHRHDGAPCPRGNGTVHRTRVAGRSAYYCPVCQPRPGRKR